MPVPRPSTTALRDVAEHSGLSMTDGELEFLASLAEDLFAACERMDHAPEARLPVRYPRHGARPPTSDENEFNAWAWRCSISGAASGLLAGKRVVLKDIIPVAGVPLSAGSPLLRGYTSDVDATVVTRILDAGGEIIGIAATEDMCLSGASVSAVTGFVLNPHDISRSAGGSTSGLAALLTANACDVGIGADQGGSIRIPSSLSGVFGMKPTYGLIPYTGCVPIDVSCDYLGPMTRTAMDNARLLEAVAGFDRGWDPRQRSDFEPSKYTALADRGVEGLRIGLVTEGFAGSGLEPDVADAVRDAADHLGALGAQVGEVSVPEHRYAMDIHGSILLQGSAEFMVRGNGIGLPGKGYYNVSFGEAFARGRARQADLLFASVKYAIVVGGYLWQTYGGRYYAKAQNLVLTLRERYEEALSTFDVLVMPTTLIKAPELPRPGAPPLEAIALALDPRLISNTCAFNHTGHPALSIPIGPSEGLPVGMMAIGRHFDEGSILRAAHALEMDGRTAPMAA